MDTVAVSVVVAVFNRETLLDRCVDSLVYQTLENIEILLVDDYSTDNSWVVMGKWSNMYPDKVRIMKSEQKGVAHAKNTGVKASRGEYIVFVDSDDYVDYKMLQWLYSTAQEEQTQLVISPIWKQTGKDKKKAGALPTLDRPYITQDFLEMSEPGYLHGKLIKKELFDEYGLFPAFRRGEDLCWLYKVYGNINSITYVNKPGYFYEVQADSICSQATDWSIFEDVFNSSDYMIENMNPQYRDWAIAYTLNRKLNLRNSYPFYQDKLKEWVEKKLSTLEERDPEEMPAILQKAIERCRNSGFSEYIPRTVFLNGFGNGTLLENLELIFGVSEQAVNIHVLNEENCDIHENPIVEQAYKNGNYEFVGHYFAVKSCYVQGGIYIDSRIEIDKPFIKLLNDPAFFGFESDAAFSDRVFGACPQNPVMEKILKTYEMPELYESPFIPLRERIKTILIGMGNIQMSSSTIRREAYGFCVYPVDMFVFSLHYSEDSCVCHYKDGTFPEEPYINIPARVLKALVDHHTRIEVDRVRKEVVKAKQETQKARELSAKRSRWIQTLEKQIADIKNSRSWKITKPLRWLIRRLGLK